NSRRNPSVGMLYRHLTPRIRLEPLLQTKQSRSKLLCIQYVGQSDFVFPRVSGRIKSCSRSHHYRFVLITEFLQHPLTETVGIVDREPSDHIERTTRIWTIISLKGVQSLNEHITTPCIFALHIFEITIGCVHGSLSSNLPF